MSSLGDGISRQLTGISDAVGEASESIATPHWGGRGVSTPTTLLVSDAALLQAPFEVHYAGLTDPGVQGKQNQDDFFLWESPDKRCLVCVGVRVMVWGGEATLAAHACTCSLCTPPCLRSLLCAVDLP